MSTHLESYMCKDIWTWLNNVGDRVFRYWIYKRMFTPYEQERKSEYQIEYEEETAKTGIIRECIELPDGDCLVGFQNVPEDWDDENEPKHLDYYKLSEIRLAYHPSDRDKPYLE